MKQFSDFEIDSLAGEPDVLAGLRRRVVLVVNVASECGYTPQYAALQALHEELEPQGFSVLGLFVEMWADNVWGTDPQGATVFEKLPHHTTLKALLINNGKQYPLTGTTSDLTRTHQGWGVPDVQALYDLRDVPGPVPPRRQTN